MMNKLNNFINSIRSDHKAHFIVGSIFGFPMVLFFGNIGGLIALIIFALKEIIYDKLLGLGNIEFMDWVYGAIPVFQFLLIYNIYK